MWLIQNMQHFNLKILLFTARWSIPLTVSAVSLSVVSVTHSQLWSKSIEQKNSKIEKFLDFMLSTILSSMIKSQVILLCLGILLVCLIYKLNFAIGMFRKKTRYV